MQDDRNWIVLDGTPVQIRNLVDLNAHWPLIRERLQSAIKNEEIADPNLRNMIEWLVVLGEKTLFRIE
ncbi:hypothetical protein WNZ15_22640 [Roseibium sp. AS2]|uniref:hypothetical protein n=1 Tax=Roseibium sp. AS2 TaxID=3135781 RepID=UPI003171985D